MTEPTGTDATIAAHSSGDHAPDTPQPAEIPTPTAPQLSDLATQRRRRPLRPGEAVYQQIAAEIRANIDGGQLAPGDPIPSEAQMMQLYGVSRPTVRNAIAALRSAGLLIVQRGRATTVRASIASAPNGQLEFDPTVTRTESGFTTWDSQGWTDVEEPSRYRTETRRHAQALQLAPAEPVFVVERQLQHTETGVEVTHRTYLPFATVADIPSLQAAPFRSCAELYQTLAIAGNVLQWSDRITTAMPTPDDAAVLDIPDGVPILHHIRITTNAQKRPLAMEISSLPGHRSEVINELPGENA